MSWTSTAERGWIDVVSVSTSSDSPSATERDQARWFVEEVQVHEPILRAYLQRKFPKLPDVDVVSSGPNAILFGNGSTGGVIALTTKRADLARDKNNVSLQFGSWGQERYSTDLNRVLVPGVLAGRLMGLYQNNESWRRYEFNDTKRWTGAVTYRPFKKTTVAAVFLQPGGTEGAVCGRSGALPVGAVSAAGSAGASGG